MNHQDQNKKSPKKSPKRPLKKYAQLTGIAFQMGATIYIAAYFGKKLDAYYQHEKNILTLILVLLATIISIWNINRQLKKFNDQ